MNPLIAIGVISLTPTLLIIITRSKAALVFMSLCVGSVLSNFVSDSALDMVQTFVRNYSPNTQSFVQLGLLLAPVLLSLLFLARSAGKKWLTNIFPAALTGVMALLLVVPLLPEGTKNGITGTQVWIQLVQYQAVLISTAVFISLAQLLSGGRGQKSKRDKRKR